MCCRKEKTLVRSKVNFFFPISAAASQPLLTSYLPWLAEQVQTLIKNLCKPLHSNHSTGTRGVMTRGLSTDIQICSPVATHSLPGQFILPVANGSSQSPLQMATKPILSTSAQLQPYTKQGRAPQDGSQEKAATDAAIHLDISLIKVKG